MSISRYESLLAMDTTIDNKTVRDNTVILNDYGSSDERGTPYSLLYLSNVQKGVIGDIVGNYTLYYDTGKTKKMAVLTIVDNLINGKLYKWTYEGSLLYVAEYEMGAIKKITYYKNDTEVTVIDLTNPTTLVNTNRILSYSLSILNNVEVMDIFRSNGGKFIDARFENNVMTGVDIYNNSNLKYIHMSKTDGKISRLEIASLNTSILDYTFENGVKTGGNITNFMFNKDIKLQHNGTNIIKAGK